jgi:hypothetical protein
LDLVERAATMISTSTATTLVRHIARMHHRPAAQFAATPASSGGMRISGPFGAVCYPPQAWLSRFCLHLCQGRFDEPVPTFGCTSTGGSSDAAAHRH